MLQKLRNRKQGFTLIELLIVVAIIGIIAALLIPNFLDALQKAKQKRTIADERNLGTAKMSLITDLASAAAAGQETWDASNYGTGQNSVLLTTHTELEAILVPQYIQTVPQFDGWGNPYSFALETVNVLDPFVMYIVSGGRDGSGNAGTYVTGAFIPTDYDQDIVWADGFFVRWASGTDARAGGGQV